LSFKEYWGIEDPYIQQLATGFGGGVGRKGSLCGAFTGAVPKDKETVAKVYGKCQEFWDRFEKELGSTNCYHLIG
jgi:C_GCAxxG_C_C family probable redox protein